MRVPVHGVESAFPPGSDGGASPNPSPDAFGMFVCLMVGVVDLYFWLAGPPEDIGVTLYGVDHVFGHGEGVQPVAEASEVHALNYEVPTEVAAFV